MTDEALVPDYIIFECLLSPQPWGDGGTVHNWRNYIGRRTQLLWNTFTDEQKIALAGDADDQAGSENWE